MVSFNTELIFKVTFSRYTATRFPAFIYNNESKATWAQSQANIVENNYVRYFQDVPRANLSASAPKWLIAWKNSLDQPPSRGTPQTSIGLRDETRVAISTTGWWSQSLRYRYSLILKRKLLARSNNWQQTHSPSRGQGAIQGSKSLWTTVFFWISKQIVQTRSSTALQKVTMLLICWRKKDKSLERLRQQFLPCLHFPLANK